MWAHCRLPHLVWHHFDSSNFAKGNEVYSLLQHVCTSRHFGGFNRMFVYLIWNLFPSNFLCAWNNAHWFEGWRLEVQLHGLGITATVHRHLHVHLRRIDQSSPAICWMRQTSSFPEIYYLGILPSGRTLYLLRLIQLPHFRQQRGRSGVVQSTKWWSSQCRDQSMLLFHNYGQLCDIDYARVQRDGERVVVQYNVSNPREYQVRILPHSRGSRNHLSFNVSARYSRSACSYWEYNRHIY